MLLNEYEIEFMFRIIRNIRNLGNVHIRGPHIVMSRTNVQNGLDFHFISKHIRDQNREECESGKLCSLIMKTPANFR